MTAAVRRFRPQSGVHADPLAGRLLIAYLISLVLHGLLLFWVTGDWLRSSALEEKPPVYYVDLVHKPVLNPQAGRPEPRVTAKPPTPTPPAPSAKRPEKAVVPSKAAPATRAPVRSSERHVDDALQKLREERAVQERLAALRQNQAVAADVPVGMPDAKGNEAGIPAETFVHATIQQNWALSPYLLKDPAKMARIEAWVRVTFSKSGRLERFSFEKESQDPQFNESIKRALIKSQQLNQPLPKRLQDVRVIFNLKAMAEMRP